MCHYQDIDLMPDSLSFFVGSTFVDLEKHRAAVLSALQRLEGVARGMEHFGALPGTPKEECLRIVRDGRVYIGIFAMRYGSTDPETGRSLTELEYEEAQRFNLRSLIYLIDEDRQPVLPKHVDLGESAEKLQALKKRLKQSHVVRHFTTPDDLAMRVTQDVARLLQDRGLAVRESALARVVQNLPKVDWIDDAKFAFFKEKIGMLADPIGSDIVLREVIEFILSGDNFSAAFVVTRTTPLPLLEAIELLVEIGSVICMIVLDGYEKMEKEGRISSAFVQAFREYVTEERRLPPWVMPSSMTRSHEVPE